MTSSPKTVALLLAAGSSHRFGGHKLLAPLHRRPLFTYSLEAFARTPLVYSILLVVPHSEEKIFRAIVASSNLEMLGRAIQFVPGGRTRHESVCAGLRALDESVEFVAIHDAARPLITPEKINHVCSAAHHFGAAALGRPVIETLHRVDQDGWTEQTLDRRSLWSIQTPQVFRSTDLKRIIDSPSLTPKEPSDEASSLLVHGIKTLLLENHEPNLKVTYQEDLWTAEKLLNSQIT